jgi:hypothetical protein
MQDLEKAKKKLNENNLSLVIIKNLDLIFETSSQGIKSFLETIERFKKKLEGASVADKVVGKAIALLCVYSKIKEIYAKTLSEQGEEILKKYLIKYEYDYLVKKILNRNGTDICPFEKLVLDISEPEKAFVKLNKPVNS